MILLRIFQRLDIVMIRSKEIMPDRFDREVEVTHEVIPQRTDILTKTAEIIAYNTDVIT